MPKDVADTFTETQLQHLHKALGVRSWKRHLIDVRTTIGLPFTTHGIYYVFLLGRNRRDLSRREAKISALVYTLFVAFFIMFSTLLGLLVLYIFKSAMGIDLFPNFSLGIWTWLTEKR